MAKDYVESCGNVLADLGVPAPDDALAKAELARKISRQIEARGLTQEGAARLLNIDQPKVSALIRGRLAGFSLERLMRLLVLLGQDVEIVVTKHSRSRSPARLRVA
jgi:predicted XRE-type DNA-binding protein